MTKNNLFKKIFIFNLITCIFLIVSFTTEILYFEQKKNKNALYKSEFKVTKEKEFKKVCEILITRNNYYRNLYNSHDNQKKFLDKYNKNNKNNKIADKPIYIIPSENLLYKEVNLASKNIILRIRELDKLIVYSSKSEVKSKEMHESLMKFTQKYQLFVFDQMIELNKNRIQITKEIKPEIDKIKILTGYELITNRHITNIFNDALDVTGAEIQNTVNDILKKIPCVIDSIELKNIDPRGISKRITAVDLVLKYIIIIGLFNLIYITIAIRKIT